MTIKTGFLVVQDAIYSALNAKIVDPDDAEAKVTVVANAKPDQTPPYIVIGEGTAQSADTHDAYHEEVTQTIHIWCESDNEYPYTAIKTIMGDIKNLLHYATLTVSGYTIRGCVWDGLMETIEVGDGRTLHGVMRFRVYFDNL